MKFTIISNDTVLTPKPRKRGFPDYVKDMWRRRREKKLLLLLYVGIDYDVD